LFSSAAFYPSPYLLGCHHLSSSFIINERQAVPWVSSLLDVTSET
jgi:hypothetical protein